MIPKYLPQKDRIELARQAKEAQRLERIWRRRFKVIEGQITRAVLDNLEETGKINGSLVDFEPFVMQHLFEVTKAGYLGAIHLAGRRSTPAVIGTLGGLLDVWERWRKSKAIPTRQRAIAKKLKADYLKKIRSVWEQHSEEWRKGSTFDKQAIREGVARDLEASPGRASTVVNTETTRYYNDARRNFYDRAPDVTHYLFLCIRDHRTTRWCSTRTGLVYEKGTAVLEKETPPIHWNCRSEIAPLSPANPAHARLIDDPRHRRSNHSPEPLPRNWNSK